MPEMTTADDLLARAEHLRVRGDRAGARQLENQALAICLQETDREVVAAETALEAAQARRLQAMEDARDRGWSYQTISEQTSVSLSRVGQLLREGS